MSRITSALLRWLWTTRNPFNITTLVEVESLHSAHVNKWLLHKRCEAFLRERGRIT
jgi:hypothetical protein